MSSKIISIIVVILFSLCIVERANAGLIVGDLYSDDAGIQWAYVGSFDLADGEEYREFNANDEEIIKNVITYNGLEAAELLFRPLTDGSVYALSSNSTTNDNNYDLVNFIVNYKAHYDFFDDELDPNYSGRLKELAQDVVTDNAGGVGYNANGDLSAFVDDRALKGVKINHVFKSITISVPEPSTIAIFSLALIGLVTRRFKN
ncbi:PEP-CTERM sorting domain-containing protein [Colwellia hornerae]|uniref:PEP-CTERM sorting domain-containing protein n=1 Tax=Colwellia hornerae TaxID=89402 RepID=A0A5C6Q3F2_9GAMM|nr:PEP-CTERM sorting domain-containing protein [Colwellia hornerae]TWX52194.1 PEP-CTERM sorting domain-containing protein [Colwellia hornerae]TWX57543.1 PEP-CTERM sorting domain-containing protein [Colwellia hornerae]TWX63356.1 PEP-CTERM sorting domain-containing protein [Colwellia hornerae]